MMTGEYANRPARLALAVATALCLVLTAAACSRDEGSASPKLDRPAQVIEPIEGMKYYVGGPIMKTDKYGRSRVAGFNGEIGAPTSRGLLLGIKIQPDKTFDYRTWLNGLPVSRSSGFLDEAGLLWFTERESFDSSGNVVSRRKLEYDNDAKIIKSTVERVEAATGDVLSSYEADIPFAPQDERRDGKRRRDRNKKGERQRKNAG